MPRAGAHPGQPALVQAVAPGVVPLLVLAPVPVPVLVLELLPVLAQVRALVLERLGAVPHR